MQLSEPDYQYRCAMPLTRYRHLPSFTHSCCVARRKASNLAVGWHGVLRAILKSAFEAEESRPEVSRNLLLSDLALDGNHYAKQRTRTNLVYRESLLSSRHPHRHVIAAIVVCLSLYQAPLQTSAFDVPPHPHRRSLPAAIPCYHLVPAVRGA